MKRLFASIMLVAMLAGICVSALTPSPDYDLEGKIRAYQQHAWRQVTTKTAADTPLNAATKYYDIIKPTSSASTWLKMPSDWTVAEFSFYCYGDGTDDGDPNGGEFDFKIHAARWNGSAKAVFEGYSACGELELSVYPADDRLSAGFDMGEQINSGSLDPNESYKWVDAIEPNGVGDVWISEVIVTTGTDDLGTVSVRTRGYWLWWVEITNFPADVTSITCVVSGYGD